MSLQSAGFEPVVGRAKVEIMNEVHLIRVLLCFCVKCFIQLNVTAAVTALCVFIPGQSYFISLYL